MTRQPAVSREIIRSRQNARLKDLRRHLLRASDAEDGLIAVEGEHLLLEAVRSGLRIDTLFLREDRTVSRGWPDVGETARFTVAAEAFDSSCLTESPQGIAALVEAPQWTLPSLLRVETPRLVVLAGLQDPGNVGAILRTAEAFGATGVLLTPGTVHPWNQKVLRSAAGSSFRLPVVTLQELSTLERLREGQIPLYACSAKAGDSVFDADLGRGFALVIGNEGAGIPAKVRAICSGSIHIPCSGPVESLNASVAAAVLLYEASRQRSRASVEGDV